MTVCQPKLCISFICQSGPLEVNALLLAASLRSFALSDAIELVVAIADEKLWGAIRPETWKLLDTLNVRCQGIASPFGKEYPIGNKLAALGVPTTAPRTLFLDSDILCLRPFVDSLETLVRKGDDKVGAIASKLFAAKPADMYGANIPLQEWKKVFQLFDLPLPTTRVLSTVDQQLMLPYFNAGVILVDDGPGFSAAWLDTAQSIDTSAHIEKKRPWLDQVSLPVTAYRLGYRLQSLTEDLNFPGHIKIIDDEKLPTLCHYHWPKVIAEEPVLSNKLHGLLAQFPALATLTTEHPEWAVLSHRYTGKAPRMFATTDANESYVRNDFFITGIPRSGTSLLCNLLHSCTNIVVINEPQEIFSYLSTAPTLCYLPIYYRELRQKILDGQAVANKVDENGEIVDNTLNNDVRREYVPTIESNSFALGTKNTLAYMSRIPMIAEVMPKAPIIAMLRHPIDTIASWKNSFPHLESVDFSLFPFAQNTPPANSPWRKPPYDQFDDIESPAMRRALLWHYLATSLIRQGDQLHLLRYEDLVANVSGEIGQIAKLLGLEASAIPADIGTNISVNRSRASLEDDDLAAINLVCVDVAASLGYSLDE